MTQINEERKAKIFYYRFDTDKINAGGWNCKEGRLYLKLTCPLDGYKSSDGVDSALENGKFVYIGEIDVKNENEVFNKLQNAFEAHELDNRSMSVGDVFLFKNEGFVVEGVGFSKLSKVQIELFKNL